MRRLLWHWALLLGLLAALGAVVAAAGLVPIAASAGHWQVTAWLLHTTLRQSVQTRSLGLRPPPLDDPARVLRGAGHYASGCAPCHGAPGEARSLIVRHMTPHPPELAERVPHWEPAELFWIVKHGIKFTGMPAWPAQERDDEVWSVVAFLLRLPALSPEEYRRLGRPPEPLSAGGARLRRLDDPLTPLLASCARCHGESGGGRGFGAFPRLDGQTETYLAASLRAFARGERHSGIMQPVAAALDEAEIAALARHYGAAATAGVAPDLDPAAVARGRRLAEDGAPADGLPSCVPCHGPRTHPRNPHYPILAGQYPDYLVHQLELFKAGRRGGTPYAHIMSGVASRLSHQQMTDLAAYYASLPRTGPR